MSFRMTGVARSAVPEPLKDVAKPDPVAFLRLSEFLRNESWRVTSAKVYDTSVAMIVDHDIPRLYVTPDNVVSMKRLDDLFHLLFPFINARWNDMWHVLHVEGSMIVVDKFED